MPTDAEPTASLEVPGGEIVAPVDSDSAVVDSLESHSKERSVVTDDYVVDLSTVPVTSEADESVLAHDPELTTVKMGFSEHEVHSVQNEGTSTGTVDVEAMGIKPVNSDSMTSGGKTKDGNIFEPVDSTEGVTSTIEFQSMNRGDLLLPSEEDTSETSLLQAREDQVTDVGCALLLILVNKSLFFFGF